MRATTAMVLLSAAMLFVFMALEWRGAAVTMLCVLGALAEVNRE